MKQLWIVISLFSLLAGCDGSGDPALLVLGEKGLAVVHSPRNDTPSTVSGSYTVQPNQAGHLISVETHCGQLKFNYKRADGLTFVDDEPSNSAAYKCGFGTQSSSARWTLALKPLTGPSLPPPEDWPR